MAYRIDYGPPLRKRGNTLPRRMPLLTFLFFLIFLFSVETLWPAGREALQQVLLRPGSASGTADALQGFISSLKDGQPFYDSFTAFCQQIIANAQLTPA